MTVRLAVPAEPASLLPVRGGTFVDSWAQALLTRALWNEDESGALVADLAERVPEWTTAGRVSRLVVRLRADATWQDGIPVTSRDLLIAIAFARRSDRPTSAWVVANRLAAWRAPDERTLEFDCARPDPVLLADLAWLLPLPAHLVRPDERLEGHPLARKPVSCGAYTLDRWARGEFLRFSRRLRPEEPLPAGAAARIELRVVSGDFAAAAALRAGQVDVAWSLSIEGGRELRRIPGVAAKVVARSAWQYVGFRCTAPPLADARLRLALVHATDRDAIVRLAYDGLGLPAPFPVLPGGPDSVSVASNGYDPNRARALLEGAGWHAAADGIRRKAVLPLLVRLAVSPGADERAAALLAAQWRDVGVSVDLRTVPASELGQADGPLARGEVDAFVAIASPVRFLRADLWRSDAQPPGGGNHTGLADPALDAEFDALGNAVDSAARTRHARAALDRWQALAPALGLRFPAAVVCCRERLEGLRPGASAPLTWNASEWRVRK